MIAQLAEQALPNPSNQIDVPIVVSQPVPSPRVLLVAYACDPCRGSEGGVGWNRAVQRRDSSIQPSSAKKRNLPKQSAADSESGAKSPACSSISFHNGGGNRNSGTSLGWVIWLTTCGNAERSGWPSGCTRRTPSIWSTRSISQPIGNRVICRSSVRRSFGGRSVERRTAPGSTGAVREFSRQPRKRCGTACNGLQLRMSRRLRHNLRRAAVLLTCNSTAQRDFAHLHGVASELFPDTGITAILDTPREDRHGGPLQILWAGQLIPRKAMDLLIEALARLPEDVRWEVRVVGDGPEKSRWQRLARQNGVDGRITWTGWVPHDEMPEQYRWADVFAFTSVRDNMGTVVLEAMGAGVPILCLDHQGAHDAVTDSCGIKIPVVSPQDTIAQLAGAIESLQRSRNDAGNWAARQKTALNNTSGHGRVRKWPRCTAAYWTQPTAAPSPRRHRPKRWTKMFARPVG